MGLVNDLAKIKGVKASDYLNASEIQALETALHDPKKHPAAKVLLLNLGKKMDETKAKELKKLAKDTWGINF